MLSGGLREDTRLFRNHVGEGWMGKVVRNDGGRVLLDRARYARFGLAPGSADIIGIRRLVIKPEHVGMVVGILVSGEVKTATGAIRKAQIAWGRVMCSFGALHATVRSPEDMHRLLDSPDKERSE